MEHLPKVCARQARPATYPTQNYLITLIDPQSRKVDEQLPALKHVAESD